MREVVVWCERHPREREGEEVTITYGGNTVRIDLCEECRKPLVELMEIGEPVVTSAGGESQKFDKTLSRRIRNAPGGPPILGVL